MIYFQIRSSGWTLIASINCKVSASLITAVFISLKSHSTFFMCVNNPYKWLQRTKSHYHSARRRMVLKFDISIPIARTPKSVSREKTVDSSLISAYDSCLERREEASTSSRRCDFFRVFIHEHDWCLNCCQFYLVGYRILTGIK